MAEFLAAWVTMYEMGGQRTLHDMFKDVNAGIKAGSNSAVRLKQAVLALMAAMGDKWWAWESEDTHGLGNKLRTQRGRVMKGLRVQVEVNRVGIGEWWVEKAEG